MMKKPQPAPLRAKVLSHDTVEIYTADGKLMFIASCDLFATGMGWARTLGAVRDAAAFAHRGSPS